MAVKKKPSLVVHVNGTVDEKTDSCKYVVEALRTQTKNTLPVVVVDTLPVNRDPVASLILTIPTMFSRSGATAVTGVDTVTSPPIEDVEPNTNEKRAMTSFPT